MSLILDALNRADNERKNQNAVPDLTTVHAAVLVKPEPEKRNALVWLLLALLIVALVFAAFLWFGRAGDAHHTMPDTQVQVVTAPASAVALLSIAAAPSSIATGQASSAPADTRSIASVAALAPEKTVSGVVPAIASSDVKDLYAPEEASVAPAVDANVNELYAAETVPESETVVDPFAAQAATAVPLAEVEREPARTFDSQVHIKDFNELPWNTKQQVPTISYQRHDYLAGGLSSVVINGQTVGVGNIVATGQFVVVDILADGVVLKQGNYTFKLRALNGWINM